MSTCCTVRRSLQRLRFSAAIRCSHRGFASFSSEQELVVRQDEEYRNENDVVNGFFADPADESGSLALRQEIRELSTELQPFLVSTRRRIHERPEVMYQEEETSQLIQNHLQTIDVPFTTGWGKNTRKDLFAGEGGFGVVADIGTGEQPCVLLRADMDALPMNEKTTVEFASTIPGKFHACGHDAHTAMLLGAASLLKQMEDSIQGTVRLMFQPAEEGGAGAKRMLDEGLLEQLPRPQHAFAIHVWPTLPLGAIASRPGPIMAGSTRFEIEIVGVGGHAAFPHLTTDPIVAAASCVVNLQSLVSRNLNPLDCGVCSVTKVQAGDAFNIIPDSVVLRGTLRALKADTLQLLRDRLNHIVSTTAQAHGCEASTAFSEISYPPTMNDPQLFETISKPVTALVSDEGSIRDDIDASMAGEDFSYIAERIPSGFFFLGQAGDNPETHRGLHDPRFCLDETILTKGVELHVNLALRTLAKLA